MINMFSSPDFLDTSKSPLLQLLKKASRSTLRLGDAEVIENALEHPEIMRVLRAKRSHVMMLFGNKQVSFHLAEAMLPVLRRIPSGRKLIMAGALPLMTFIITGCSANVINQPDTFRMGQAAQTAEDNKEKIGAMQQMIDGLQSSLKAAQQRIQTLEGASDGIVTALGKHNASITNIIEGMGKTTEAINTLGKNQEVIDGNTQQLATNQQNIVETLGSQGNTLNTVQQGLEGQGTKLSSLENDVSLQGNTVSSLQETQTAGQSTQQYLLEQMKSVEAAQKATTNVIASDLSEVYTEDYLGGVTFYYPDGYDQMTEVVFQFDDTSVQSPFIEYYDNDSQQLVRIYGEEVGDGQYTFRGSFSSTMNPWGRTTAVTIGADTTPIFQGEDPSVTIKNFSVVAGFASFQNSNNEILSQWNGATFEVKRKQTM